MRNDRRWGRPAIGLLLSTAVAVFVNYATIGVPEFIRAHRWISWVVIAACVVLLIGWEVAAQWKTARPGVDRSAYRLNLHEIDALPLSDELHLASISYGEGPATVTVPADRLYRPPRNRRFAGPGVSAGDLLTERQLDSLARTRRLNATSSRHVAFPHAVRVSGVRSRPGSHVAVYVVTDICYLQEIDTEDGSGFSADCLLGTGGITAFTRFRDGAVQVAGPMGPAALLVAVEWVDRAPVKRTSYVVMVRSGIRYPDDLWLSPLTGLPLLSNDSPEARFAFQSRQPNALSHDVFIADLDGARMINLSRKEFDAYDGLHGPDGDFGAWVDETHLRYFSRRRGRGQTTVGADTGRSTR